MYLNHFRLHSAPFSITPDPRFVYLTDRHREGLAHLLYGLGQGGSGGFVVLTGEVGTGKTTLCRLALEQLPSGTDVALVLNPSLNPLELLETICEELRLDVAGLRGQMKPLVDLLNRHLLSAHADGRRVVLLLDEAQNLSADSLEQVRLLTNLETATQKLLQIILLGQPELTEKLAKPELRQLAQRVTARYHLSALNQAESIGYVQHRLFVAGDESSASIFDASALKALHKLSRGVPRVLNVLADHALLAGFADNKKIVNAALVRRAAGEVLPNWHPARRRSGLIIFAGMLAAGLAVGGFILSQRLVRPFVDTFAVSPERLGVESIAPMASAGPVTSLAEQATRQMSANALTQTQVVTAWLRKNGLTATPDLVTRALRCPNQLASQLNVQWRCLSGEAGPEFFKTVRLPLLRQVNGVWTMLPPPDGFSGRYRVLYQLPKDAPEVFGLGYAGAGVAELSRLLAVRDGGASAQRIYGPRMLERVVKLQRALAIKADGVVGPETWVALLETEAD